MARISDEEGRQVTLLKKGTDGFLDWMLKETK